MRIEHSWRLAMPLVLIVLALIGGMWWWGFDFGQIPRRVQPQGGRRRSARRSRPKRDQLQGRQRAAARQDDASSKASSAMARGAQATLVAADARAAERERAAQGGARLPADSSFATASKQGGDLDPAALGRARRATTPSATACWSCAAASRRDEFAGRADACRRIWSSEDGTDDDRRCPTTSRRPRRRCS